MIRKAALAAALLVSPVPLAAQAGTSPAAGHDADARAIDDLVARVYAVISGPAGPRDWAAFRALFVPEARLVPVGPRGPILLGVDDYIERAGALMATEPFHEAEIARRVDRYGGIAHVFSTYETRRSASGPAFARGMNSIQLVRTPAGWRVLQIAWQQETPALPLPPAYLPAEPRR